jgi:hypothetical protein
VNKWIGCEVNVQYYLHKGVTENGGWVASTPAFHTLKILGSTFGANTKYPDD